MLCILWPAAFYGRAIFLDWNFCQSNPFFAIVFVISLYSSNIICKLQLLIGKFHILFYVHFMAYFNRISMPFWDILIFKRYTWKSWTGKWKKRDYKKSKIKPFMLNLVSTINKINIILILIIAKSIEYTYIHTSDLQTMYAK